MKVLLLRHGQTEINTRTKVHGKGDEAGLDEFGVSQAKALATLCYMEGVRKVYCSPEKRAKQTAEIITSNLGFDVVVIEQFGERDWGDWSGRLWSDIQAELQKMDLAQRYSFIPPNGESWEQMDNRLQFALDKIISTAKVDAIAVITHGGVLRALMPMLKGEPKETSFRYDFKNASATSFDYEDSEWHLLLENDTAHLNKEV